MGDMLVSRRVYQGPFEILFKKNSWTKPLNRIAKKTYNKNRSSQESAKKSHQIPTAARASEPEPRAIPSAPLWPLLRRWLRGQLQQQLPGEGHLSALGPLHGNNQTSPPNKQVRKIIHSFFVNLLANYPTILNFWGVKSNERSSWLLSGILSYCG